MIKLDDNLLAELGLHALPAEEKKNLLRHIYETLELRVGTTLAQQMTDAQLDEFESFINNNDEAGALHWLETNFPNYKDVVAHEFELLKNEVRQAAPQILASAQQQVQMPQPQAMPQQSAGMPAQGAYVQPQSMPMPQQQQPYGGDQSAPGMPQQQPSYPGTPAGQPYQPMPPQYVQPQPPQHPAAGQDDQSQYDIAA